MNIHYSVRFHKEYVDDLSFLDSYSCFLVEETVATRTHYQGILVYGKSPNALRALIRLRNPRMVGNRAYSAVRCKDDIEDLKTYYCKGASPNDPPVIIKNTLPIDNIDERHKLYYEVQLSRKRKDKGNLYNRVFDGCDRTFSNPDSVVCHIVKYYMDNDKPINETQIKSLAITYLAKNLPGYASRLKNRIVQQIEHL